MEKYGRARRATDYIIKRRKRLLCWMNKATHKNQDIHSEYVILIAFSQQKYLRERISVLRYTKLSVCAIHVLTPPKIPVRRLIFGMRRTCFGLL